MKTKLHPATLHHHWFILPLCALGLAGTLTARAGVAPTVFGVTASQQAGTKNVNITYNLTDPDPTTISIYVQLSADGGTNWTVPANTFFGASAYGGGVTPGNGKTIVWNAGADWDGQYTTQCRVRILANDADPEGFIQIAPSSFTMGDTLGDTSNPGPEYPVHSVSVSAFQIEKSLVTGARWNAVYQWALAHNYSFDNAGTNKASTHPIRDHPVQTINWFDAVKWCNARSQLEGRTPTYYTDAGQTAVYKTGQVAPYVNWAATGYRLPTEAEWEKSARGGLIGKRFPWGDTITTNQANYCGSGLAYNLSGAFGYHPAYATGGQPFTSPVASFGPNGYGLFDMAGNVFEWCWDWYASNYYISSPGNDPRGPASSPLSYRVLRGGGWYDYADFARCAYRGDGDPGYAYNYIGFRCVRGL